MKTLYLLFGLWGSGKSTWAKQYVLEHTNTKIVSADGFRLMVNGEYKYLVELDDIIDECMIDTANHLLNGGFDVIIDVCNLTKERRNKWLSNINADRNVAIVFPRKDKKWHLGNRIPNAHRFETYETWNKWFDKQIKAFEPIDKKDFDEIIEVEEW